MSVFIVCPNLRETRWPFTEGIPFRRNEVPMALEKIPFSPNEVPVALEEVPFSPSEVPVARGDPVQFD